MGDYELALVLILVPIRIGIRDAEYLKRLKITDLFKSWRCEEMPQQKQPTSLFWMCVFDVSKMIQEASDKIHEESLTPSSTLLGPEATAASIRVVQGYFCDPLPYLLLEMICNRRHHNALLEKPQCVQRLLIFLKIVMHRNLTIFHLPRLNIVPNLLSTIPDSFWCRSFSQLSKLQHLNLSNVCTDELLAAIADNCPLLEDIKIISKSRNMSAEFNFNALRKAYHVTDNGLLCLAKCKKLKRISIGSARVHNRQITPKCIATLLTELPELRDINYPCMNMVLQQLESPLQFKIRQVVDQHCSLDSVQLYIRHFPHLQILHLELSKGGDLSKENQYKQTGPIVEALKSSSLRLNRLVLSSFWVAGDVLLDYLSAKGGYLSELVLDSRSCEVNAKMLILIGKSCPFLVQLIVKDLETGEFNGHIPNGLFSDLQILSFSSKNSWDVSTLLSILFQGGRLSVLSIDVYYNLSNMNTFFREYLSKNQLVMLRKVVFGGSAAIAQLTIESFYKKCPQLKFFMCSESLVQLKRETFLEDLRDDITSHNYDFDLFIFD